MRAGSAAHATLGPRVGAMLLALVCVVLPTVFGVQQAGAATISIGAVAGAAEVGPGTTCSSCRGFQRQTDPAGPSYTVPAGNWVLTSWSVRAGADAQTVRLIMGEPVAGDMTGNEFTLRVETGYETTVPDTVTTFQANIPVEPGWLLGQDSGTGSTWLYLTDDTDDVVKGFNNSTTVGNQGTSGVTFTGYRVNIAATLESDYDNDDVPDDSADLDDDGDGVGDTSDLCPTGATGWTSGPMSDHDADGCRDSDEDADDDNDGLADAADQCPAVAGPASTNGCPFSPPPPTVRCAGRDATKVGTTGSDTLVGTPGPDVFAALGGADTIKGLGGNDVVCGGDGADIVRGAGGRDTLLGQAGNDRLFGDKGADDARGGAGRDTVAGGVGNDRLFGDKGRDRVVGSSGNDLLKGGAGPDTLLGGLGRDRLIGGAGLDELDAGPGDDFDERQ